MLKRWVYRDEEPGAEGGGGAGEGGGNWRAALPDDLRDSASLQDFADVGALAKSYTELKAFQGRSVRAPSEDASPDAWNEFYDKVNRLAPGKLMPTPNPEDEEAMAAFRRASGVPEKAEEYEIPEIEGHPIPEERAAFLREVGIKAGIPKGALKKAAELFLERDKGALEGMEASRQEGLGKLKQEWGAAYDTRLGAAMQFAETDGVPDYIRAAAKAGQLDAPMAKWLHGLSTRLNGSSSRVADKDRSGGDTLTPEEARLQVQEILDNPQHPYNIANHPGYSAAAKKVRALRELANAGR